MCTREGLPIAVEVFEGNTADPTTLAAQIEKLKTRFGIERVVLVGDRGMITTARIRDDLGPAGLDWITCLRAPQIQALAQCDGPLQLSLFDERDLAEISSPDFPGERLIVCRNRDLAAERARKREDLLVATERELARVAAQVRRKGSPLRTAADIGLAVGAVVNLKKMAKHFAIEIRDGYFAWRRRDDQIAAEARLDGIYVIRTSVPAAQMDAAQTVQAYKDLSRVERAFRSLKTVDLEIRPIRHWNADRVRAHVFLCMLAYHVEWHLRQALAPLLFHDIDIGAAKAERRSPVASTEPRNGSDSFIGLDRLSSIGAGIRLYRRNKKPLCSLALTRWAWRSTVQSERDVWNTTFYHRAIRRKIGEALSAGHDLSRPLPERIRTLLVQLDDPNGPRHQ